MRWLSVAALVVAALVVACGAPAPTLTPPPGAVVIVAQGTAFTTQHVTAPAGAAFSLWFDNHDNELHNVHIRWPSGASIAIGDTFTGPAARIAQIDPLAPGDYVFACDIHPQMTGELVAQ